MSASTSSNVEVDGSELSIPFNPVKVGESSPKIAIMISLYGEVFGAGPPPVGGFLRTEASFLALDSRSFHFFLHSSTVRIPPSPKSFIAPVIDFQAASLCLFVMVLLNLAVSEFLCSADISINVLISLSKIGFSLLLVSVIHIRS